MNLVRKSFRAEVRQVDFKHSASAASDEINKWVERNTKGKIKDVVEPGQFADLTRLVLCNAIYFNGKWLHQFKMSDTKPAPFHVTTNETVTVPMMFQESEFKMAVSDDYAIELLELPYSGNNLSMIILLPVSLRGRPNFEPNSLAGLKQELAADNLHNLYDLEQKLTVENLHTWLAKLDQANPHKTSVGLPRFTTIQSFDLTKELKSLGMPLAFGDTTNLYISDVLHKAFAEVNEAGPEAAAATSVEMTLGMSESGHFIVDHPFIFLIRENGSGTILFLGRIIDPTK
jgi:serpin B